MTSVQIQHYRYATYPSAPWRNGGGVTQEVARQAAAGSAAFDWRVSIAQVNEDGPFSLYEGWARIIAVMEGAGISLALAGHPEVALLPHQPFAFSGDVPVQGRLLDGPIRDLNLIYSPARYQVRLQCVAEVTSMRFLSGAPTALVLNTGNGALRLQVDGQEHVLAQRYDCLRIDTAGPPVEYCLAADALGSVCVIELFDR